MNVRNRWLLARHLLPVIVTAFVGVRVAVGEVPQVPRAVLSLDADWRFAPLAVEGAQAPEFDDHSWRLLDLPHDWGIEGEYRRDNPAGGAGAYLPCGVGWYRR